MKDITVHRDRRVSYKGHMSGRQGFSHSSRAGAVDALLAYHLSRKTQ